jgi:hypothetical protein
VPHLAARASFALAVEVQAGAGTASAAAKSKAAPGATVAEQVDDRRRPQDRRVAQRQVTDHARTNCSNCDVAQARSLAW